MKYLVALALALGVVALAGIDAQAAVRCGPNAVITTIPTARNGPSVKAAGITIPRNNTRGTIGTARSGLSVNRIPPPLAAPWSAVNLGSH